MVNAADSDHRAAVEALVAGLAGSHKPLIHASGSIVGDEAMGKPSERVVDEDSWTRWRSTASCSTLPACARSCCATA